jgi:predicted NBD/HSP70 family sugar kinase
LVRPVSDSDSVRRQNRGLVLEALRLHGPLPRTRIAQETGLSNASLTAISQDMIAQGLLTDLIEPVRGKQEQAETKLRGRPAVRLGFNRAAAYICLVEIDVTRARFSLVDYGGILIDRIEANLAPSFFSHTPAPAFIAERIEHLHGRNPNHAARPSRIALSLQGILDRDGQSLKWSPVAGLAGQPIGVTLAEHFGAPVTLNKRGRLLAEGTRWLDTELRDASVATVFVGSTVAMGITFRGRIVGRGDDGATEFGHMNHAPNGALCRCGMRGCVEAYAADYGLLRTAYSVPETTTPALAVPAADYDEILRRAERGDRNAVHAFNLAGRAIGYGLSRLMAVFDPSHIIIVGPGARGFPLMEAEIDAALAASLVCKVSGTPEIRTHLDESEPIFRGLMMKTLHELDQLDFSILAQA